MGAKIVAGALISFWFPIFLPFIWCTESFITFAGHTFQVSLVRSVIRTILHCIHRVGFVCVCVCARVCVFVYVCVYLQETWVQSLGWEDPLEKGMVTHSSILAWEIPWTEEPGRLQSMGSQRVRHD